MAIPIFEDFLYPFLLATNGKDMTVSEMREYIIDYFGCASIFVVL